MAKSVIDQIYSFQNSPEYIELSAFYSSKSMFDYFKLSRREDFHSNFLSWLLDPSSDHKLGDFPLRQFLFLLAVKSKKNNNAGSRYMEDELATDFLASNFQISLPCTVRTEVPTSVKVQNKAGRIDILIETTVIVNNQAKHIPIIIENKVKSKEHDRQTVTYYEWAKQHYSCVSPVFVFLSPSQDSQCCCKHFIKLTYQDIVDCIIEPCQKRCESVSASALFKQYLRCLTIPYFDGNEKGDVIMAISTDERNLLEKFYDKNRELFISVFEMLCNDDEISEDERKSMETAIATVRQKDYSKYIFENKIYGKSPCVLAVVKKTVEEKDIHTFEDLERCYPKKVQGSYGVIKRHDALTDSEKRYRRFNIGEQIELGDGTKVVVCTQWGIGNFPKFIEAASTNGYHILNQA